MTGYEGKGSKEATSNFKHTLGAVSRRSGFYFHQNATFVCLRLVFPTSILVPSCIGPERLILPDRRQREKGPHRQIGAQKALERMCHQRCRVQPHATIFQEQC